MELRVRSYKLKDNDTKVEYVYGAGTPFLSILCNDGMIKRFWIYQQSFTYEEIQLLLKLLQEVIGDEEDDENT